MSKAVKTDHPVQGLFLAAQKKPGWEFDPQKFNLPNFPIHSGSIDQHSKATAIRQHLMIGAMLGHITFTPSTQQWQRVEPRYQRQEGKLK